MVEVGFFALVLASVFLVIDSFGNVPIFIALLHKYPNAEKKQIIRKSFAIAFVSFLFFSFFGVFIFDYLDIDLFSFKIAGGLLLLFIAFEMLFGFKTRTEFTTTEEEKVEEKENLTITPLAIPLITGPGAITTGIVLFSKSTTLLLQAQFLVASLLAFAAGYIVSIQAKVIFDRIGLIGTKLITRIMGLLLGALAVQFILSGLAEAVAVLF